eukprot:4915-Heterococcus_DN1.PRE.1
MTVYVKDVFRNSGRFTLTLDDSMNRQKFSIVKGAAATHFVSFLRQKKRDGVSKFRRSRRDTTCADEGTLTDGDEVRTWNLTRVSSEIAVVTAVCCRKTDAMLSREV